MAAFTIDPMRESHLPAILAIEKQLFPSPWTEGMFRQEVTDDHLSRPVVGVLDKEVVAYMVSWFLREEVHLLNIAVAPLHQGNGFGRTLLAFLIDQAAASGRELIALEVRAGNEPARALYDSFGFKPVGVRKKYYDDSGEDAVIMMLELTQEGRLSE